MNSCQPLCTNKVTITSLHLQTLKRALQIKRHYYQLLAERELTKHRDLSDEKRTFLVMERLKLPSNDNKKLSTRIAEEHSIEMSCQEIGEFLRCVYG